MLIFLTPYLIPITTPSDILLYPYGDSHHKNINGYNVHHRIIVPDKYEKGIVLIHGFGGSVFSWRNQESLLKEKNILTVMVDLPGFGHSDRKSGFSHTTVNRSFLVWALLDEIEKDYNLDNSFVWTLVGHSMGAGVADRMGNLRPEKVESIIYVDGSIEVSGRNITIAGYHPIKRWIEVLVKYFVIREKNIISFLESAYGRKPEQSEIEGYYIPLKLDGTEKVLVELLKSEELFMNSDFSEVNIPRAAIWGSEDTWVGIENIDSLKSKYPDIEVYIIEDAYHCPMETHYEDFNNYLGQLLQ